MKKLLYLSPLWPKRSGISEYSEGLLLGLRKLYDITIYVDGYVPENSDINKNYKIVKKQSDLNFKEFDEIIYNFGNNPDFHDYMYDMLMEHPGYIILHDFVLFYLTVGHYQNQGKLLQKIYEMAGPTGIQVVKDSLKKNHSRNLLEHKDIADLLPLNKEVIDASKGIFVHSEYARQLVRNINPEKKVKVIEAYMKPLEEDEEENFLRKKYNIAPDATIISSFGMIAPTKQNELISKAVNFYNGSHTNKLYYVMCGEGTYVDSYLSEYIKKTGFLSNKEFASAITDCDIVMNLRYPYNGETSATLIQTMKKGKACMVTDIGSFSEIPDDCVLKISKEITEEELCEKFEIIMNCQKELIEKSRVYANGERFAVDTISETIKAFLEGDKE
ncbi:MAG: hypothetical protein MR799_00570 [Lachnospiraceae bacterium]|nr:hypothetical protein [Lachnospiraceae bacterium]